MKNLILIIFVLFLHSSWAFSQIKIETEESKIASTWLNSVMNKNHEITRNLLDSLVVWEQPGNNVLSGIKKSRQEVFAMSKKMHALTDKTFKLKQFEILASNDKEVVCRLHFTANRVEETNLEVQNIDIYTIKNGKIVKVRVFSADIEQENLFWGNL